MSSPSLKLAVKEDIPIIINLAKDLFSNSYYSLFTTFDEDVVGSTANRIIDDYPNGVIITLQLQDRMIGFIAGQIAHNLIHSREKTALEVGFWITDNYVSRQNIRLLYGAYRYWAKLQGCDLLQMGKITDKNKPESFYYRKLKS